MNNEKENMKDLFEKFFDSEQAEKGMEDFQKVEELFDNNPAPQPDKTLIVGIKTRMNQTLLRKKANAFRTIAYKTMAVAAAVIIITAISVKLFEKDGSVPEKAVYASKINEQIWEGESADLQTLAEEIGQVAQDMIALRLDENNGNGQIATTQLEMELIEIDSDFWKG